MRLNVAAWLAFSLLCVGDMQNNPSPKTDASPVIGLQIGQQSPVFTFRDQFGRTGSSATLRGTNGTVLLFFRSADW
jgi:hypothetical protein